MKNVITIISLFLGLAAATLVLNRSRDTVAVTQAATSGLDRLLRTVTLQNSGFGSIR